MRGEKKVQQLFQTGEVFTSLVKEIHELMHIEVFIANEEGMIIASTMKERLNVFHEGAYLSLKKRKEIVVTEELSKKLKGAKQGIVIPFYINGVTVGSIGLTGDIKVVKIYAPIAQKLAELYLKNAVDQLADEKKNRNIELFVFDWLNDNLTEQQLYEKSMFFQIDIKKYRQVICVNLPMKIDEFSMEEIDAFRQVWNGQNDALFVRWGRGRLVIIDEGLEREKLKEKLNALVEKLQTNFDENVCVGVGQVMSYTKIATSFKQAEAACIIAQKEKKIVFEEELRFEMLQYQLDDQTKKIFIERTISSILDDESLLKTLDSWLENNMSIQHTAEALNIHKNTLYYRLEKITNLTSLDVNDIHHIVLLYLSNRFLKEVV